MNKSATAPDFTEARYEQLLVFAKKRYRFEPFGTTCAEPHVLWRHDIDYSVQRASRIASIEKANDVRATYFFLLTSPYYSLLEREDGQLARAIASDGHHIGLHFDPSVYDGRRNSDLLERIASERAILEDVVETNISVISFHNPTYAGLLNETASHIGGLLNVYGGQIRKDYTYSSDSSGFWRFRPIAEVLADEGQSRLHILTHPVWWCPEPLSPRAKIMRCVDGRAAASLKVYDELLKSAGLWDAVMAQEGQ
jgi:peptidoglycan/xylan/chitin deacetylase (PgdA/CDA1 family)